MLSNIISSVYTHSLVLRYGYNVLAIRFIKSNEGNDQKYYNCEPCALRVLNSRLEPSTRMQLKLPRAFIHHGSQNNMNEWTIVKMKQIKFPPSKFIKCHRKIKRIIKESTPHDFSRQALCVCKIWINGDMRPSNVT